MKVAVFGSWSNSQSNLDWNLTGTWEVFQNACRDIGRALANKGHTLIVETENPHTADPYIVKAYVEHAVSGPLREMKIELAWPRGRQRPFEDSAQANPNLFIYHQLLAPEADHQRWSNSHLVSLKNADAILTIGGQQGTYLAGSAAMVAKKPLVPIASFGGASARLLVDLQADRDSNFDPINYGLNGPWSPHVLERALGLLEGDTSKTRIFISHAHADESLARALVGMITKAFEIPDEAIRCTSLPGYKLSAGVHTASQLRKEIENTEVVLGVITPRSIESQYVLLELGAAWGLGRRTFPLVARGVQSASIPGPFSELHWIDLATSQDCLQLIDDLSSVKSLGSRRKSSSGAIVDDAVKQLVAYAQQLPI